jgi:hypothetical protein
VSYASDLLFFKTSLAGCCAFVGLCFLLSCFFSFKAHSLDYCWPDFTFPGLTFGPYLTVYCLCFNLKAFEYIGNKNSFHLRSFAITSSKQWIDRYSQGIERCCVALI